MHRSVLLFLVISAGTTAPTTDEDAKAKILEYYYENDGAGNYVFRFETSNGLTRFEIGQLVNAGQSDERIFVRGDYSYKDADGNLLKVRYIADENGYQVLSPSPSQSPNVDARLPEDEPIVVSGPILASLLG